MSMRTEFELSGDAAAALEQLTSQPGLSRGRVIEALSALVWQRLTGADAGAAGPSSITIQDETETEVWLREWTPGTEPQPAQLVVEAAESPRAANAPRNADLDDGVVAGCLGFVYRPRLLRPHRASACMYLPPRPTLTAPSGLLTM